MAKRLKNKPPPLLRLQFVAAAKNIVARISDDNDPNLVAGYHMGVLDLLAVLINETSLKEFKALGKELGITELVFPVCGSGG